MRDQVREMNVSVNSYKFLAKKKKKATLGKQKRAELIKITKSNKQKSKETSYYLIWISNIFTFKSTSLVLFWQRNEPHIWISKKHHFKTPKQRLFLSQLFLDIRGFYSNHPKITLKVIYYHSLPLYFLLSKGCKFIPCSWKLFYF